MAKRTTSSEKVQANLKSLVDHFYKEDYYVRERQLRQWKRLKCIWDGFHRLWWSETAHDWRIYDSGNTDDSYNNEYYDKTLNVFRAYLESIIAALSVSMPGIKCYPDDADNPSDLETARAGDNIAKILYRHNDVMLLWIHALFIYCTEGMIAHYNYTKDDEKYGTYADNTYEEGEEVTTEKVCPVCGTNLQSEEASNTERDEFDPGDDDINVQNILGNSDLCPQCIAIVDPETKENRVIVTRLTGITHKPKSRQCMEVYGGLFVKIPNYAQCQDDIPYLIFAYETHYSNVLERFDHLRNKFDNDGNWTGASATDFYERWARTSNQYRGEEPRNTVTVRNCWFRPSAFNILGDPNDIKELKKLFPSGCKVVFVNDEWAEDCNQALDDHWTLSKNPLSDYLHHVPLGMLLVSVQEITNELLQLTLQTIEHGVSQSFADQDVLDFQAYASTEVAPGMMYPVKAKSGKSLAESFFELKTANLGPEVGSTFNKIQEMGQVTSGAMPSIFGGELEGNKTASGLSQSRAMALQRLQTPWKMLSMWWKNAMAKSIAGYIKDVAHDERIVEKTKSGNFVNVMVRRAQLSGKIGDIELEAAENLPIAWGQNKETIMQLMQSNNEELMGVLTDPDNLPYISDAIGMAGLKIPGSDDREVQWEEIRQLLDTEPMDDVDPMTGMPREMPSVNIEPTVDNNIIHSDICRRFLVSPAGRLAKIENPAGYKNVLLHMQLHVHVVQAMQAMNAAQQPAGPNEEGKPSNNNGSPTKPEAANETPVQ